MEDKKVDCCEHGERYPAYICNHLVGNQGIGFNEPFESNPNEIYDNDELTAWCDECDKVLEEEGEWNKKALDFAYIRLCCDKCFFKMKELSKK